MRDSRSTKGDKPSHRSGVAFPHPAANTAEQTPQVLPDNCAELHISDISAHAAKRDDGTIEAPEWVHFCPAGEMVNGEMLVRGRDGREFVVLDPNRVIAGTELPMQLDRDHESVLGGFFTAPNTRASGWLDQIQYVAPGEETKERPEAGFWGHVEAYTKSGRADVEGREYRGLSPVVRYERREPIEEGGERPAPALIGFVNIALTNRPNLRMQMLHAEQRTAATPEPERETMDPTFVALAERLGLTGEFSAGQLVDRVTAKFTKDAEALADLQDRVRASEVAANAAKIEAVLDRYAECYPPAERASHREFIEHVPNGMEKFEARFKNAPKLLEDAAADKDSHKVVLTGEEAKIAEAFGYSADEWKEGAA